MTIARKFIVNPNEPGWYHCISRCVRRAFLCGRDHATGRNFEHRRSWIRQRLQHLSSLFSVEVAGYAIMSNHIHLVIRMDPNLPKTWSDIEVVTRWLKVFPGRFSEDGTPLDPSPEAITGRSRDPAFVERVRARLGNLSWLMRALKEPIARRANKEDECGGSFWEGRFTSVALLDEAAVVACMAYVDLNPIRARIAESPEQSHFTSIQERLSLQLSSAADNSEHLGWLKPIEECATGISARRYFELVDCSGRHIRGDKSGSISPSLPHILQRLGLDEQRWYTAMERPGEGRGTAMGHATTRIVEAMRRGVHWVASYSVLFAGARLRQVQFHQSPP